MKSCIVVAVLFFSLFASRLEAKRIFLLIGPSDSIHKLSELHVRGPKGERVFLGYRTTAFYLGLGIGLSKQGYVLGCVDNPGKYYPLTPEVIKELQKENYLPTPLPSYQPGKLDYLFACSLWWALGAFLLFYVSKGFLHLLDVWRKKRGGRRAYDPMTIVVAKRPKRRF